MAVKTLVNPIASTQIRLQQIKSEAPRSTELHWSAQDSATGVTLLQQQNIPFCETWHSNSSVAEDSESCETWRSITGRAVANVAKDYRAVIFMVQQFFFDCLTLMGKAPWSPEISRAACPTKMCTLLSLYMDKRKNREKLLKWKIEIIKKKFGFVKFL